MHFLAEGAMAGEGEEIGAGFAGGIGGAGIERRLLGEFRRSRLTIRKLRRSRPG